MSFGYCPTVSFNKFDNKKQFLSKLVEESEEELEEIEEEIAEKSEPVRKLSLKNQSGGRLVRSASLNQKQYHSFKEMLIDIKNHENGKNVSFHPSSRKVTFTLANDYDPPDYKKYRSTWLKKKVKILNRKLKSLSNLLSDWMFLGLLGINVAVLSIVVDMLVYSLQLLQETIESICINCGQESYLQWTAGMLAWCSYTTVLVVLSAGFVNYVGPRAIGSGIPEMKTIIRGVVLIDYLTLRTLISKVVGISLALGSGIPIGKMGPFVHIASVVANQMCILASKFDVAYKEESRRMECLAAACAVGVACTFSAPVGGVLFAIEVTTMYFSVRSYWRGFFAACCGATTIRLLRGYLVQTEVTVNAFYQTSFRPDAFSVNEIPLFIILGLLCAGLGSLYTKIYRHLVLFLRNNQYAKHLFQRHWFVYPIFISFIYAFVSFPGGLGTFSTGRIRFGTNLKDFFANCAFLNGSGVTECGHEIYSHWMNRGNILMLLVLFIIVHFIFSIISFTIPVPSGVFLPIFVLGAALGRLYGEIIAIYAAHVFVVNPGVYAVVGAAAFSASVTHTVSVSVMIFEITGQLHFILPVMTSVMLANAVGAFMQSSFFDTIIKIKNLPFLPDIPPSNNLVYTTKAEDIMVAPVKFLCKLSTFHDIQDMIKTEFRVVPVVDSESTQMLIGTVSRKRLIHLMNNQIGDHVRKLEAERRVRKAIETIDNHFKDSAKELTDEKRRRTCSEADLRLKAPDLIPLADTIEPSGPVEQVNRFLVVPLVDVTEPKILIPPNSPISTSPVENTLRQVNSNSRRNALFSLQEMDSRLSAEFLGENGVEHKTIHGNPNEHHTIIKGYMKQAKKYLHQMQFGANKKNSQDTGYDLTPEERKVWEDEQLSAQFELTDLDIDSTPSQLVKRTSLYKIHSIFSMLQLSKAYVTDCGKLVGVVALSDLRKALEHTEEMMKTAKRGAKAQDIEQQPIIPLRPISTNVIDILTPPLEIARGTTIETNVTLQEEESMPKLAVPPPTFMPRSSLRREKSEQVGSSQRNRRSGSVFEHRPEEFVEAVAYLRRKSLAVGTPTRSNKQDDESSD
ncbi:unnamed protein product [Caenorhabditis angaria]|uniref:CBS domain-containing protein n=1 Tax=Caenorhabditis angaria TaxID=860376 RepID=A0A9P1J1R8_9PELO|nr:unnamed protein product [Caenorhabditis angaria]